MKRGLGYMKSIERISLQERLNTIQNCKPDFLEVFEMFPEDYFVTWTDIHDNVLFLERYEDEICCYSFSDGKQHYLNETVRMVQSLPDEERDDLLYKILVEPFVFKREEKN